MSNIIFSQFPIETLVDQVSDAVLLKFEAKQAAEDKRKHILRGVKAIAEYRQEAPSTTYAKLAKGEIDADKDGKSWVTTTDRLDAQMNLKK